MAKYKIVIKKDAQKFLDNHLELKTKALKILNFIADNTENNMKLFDIKTMQSYKNRYRLRIASYRIVFDKIDNEFIITVVRAGNRGDIYKGL